MNEDILIPARRYLRAWALSTDLAGVPPAYPWVQRILGTALPSTREQNALECHFVESLTWSQFAKGASTEAAAADAYQRTAPYIKSVGCGRQARCSRGGSADHQRHHHAGAA